MLELTKQEKQVIVFLMATALLGVGILCYKNLRYHPKIEIIPNQIIDNQISESKIININTASKDEIVGLKGIGPALAEAIIEYRTVYGPLKDKEDIKNVKGLGQKKFEEIKDNIKIE